VIDAVTIVWSGNGGILAPLFPDQFLEGAAYDAMINRVMGNEIIRGKLLSTDGEFTSSYW
jgi:uncharacterized protein